MICFMSSGDTSASFHRQPGKRQRNIVNTCLPNTQAQSHHGTVNLLCNICGSRSTAVRVYVFLGTLLQSVMLEFKSLHKFNIVIGPTVGTYYTQMNIIINT